MTTHDLPDDYDGLTLVETMNGRDLTAEHVGKRIVNIDADGCAFFGIVRPRTPLAEDPTDPGTKWHPTLGIVQEGPRYYAAHDADVIGLDETVQVWA